MIAEIEQWIIDALRDDNAGLSSEASASWYVPRTSITRVPPGQDDSLPAVFVSAPSAVVCPAIGMSTAAFPPHSSPEQARTTTVFEVECSVTALAGSPDQASIVAEQAFRILHGATAREASGGLSAEGEDFRVLAYSPLSLNATDRGIGASDSYGRELRITLRVLFEISQSASVIEDINIRRFPWDSWGERESDGDQ